MTHQKALNGSGRDGRHYDEVLMKDAAWLGGSVVVGVLAALAPMLFGGYGLNWQTILFALILALAVKIALGSLEGFEYCRQMIYNRRSAQRDRARHSTGAARAV